MVTRVKVGPKGQSTHDISLSGKDQTWGLILEKGARSIQEIPQTPSTIHFSGGGTKFGDWEPGFSHLEQRTYFGGRGLEDFSKDPTRFWDSYNAFTMLDGKCFPAPQWKFATGLRTTHEDMPGDVGWRPLTGTARYMSEDFTVGGSNLSADNAEIWIRRIGSPGKLTVEIWSDTGGSPNVVVASATANVTTATITDWKSEFYTFDLSAAGDLTSSTKYHLVVYGASADNQANHWEIGVDTSGTCAISSAGSSWSSESTYGLYYRVSDTDVNRKWHFFILQNVSYAIDQREDGTASSLFMNGERGKATSGSASTLVDTSKGIKGSWTADEWNGYYIRIRRGVGRGQWRLISDTATNGTITVTPDWDTSPDSTSDYIIYGGPAWQDISPSTGDQIDGVVTSVAAIGWKAYFAQGPDTNILRMQYDNSNSPPSHEFSDDGTNRADLVFPAQDAVAGPRIIRILNAVIGNQY